MPFPLTSMLGAAGGALKQAGGFGRRPARGPSIMGRQGTWTRPDSPDAITDPMETFPPPQNQGGAWNAMPPPQEGAAYGEAQPNTLGALAAMGNYAGAGGFAPGEPTPGAQINPEVRAGGFQAGAVPPEMMAQMKEAQMAQQGGAWGNAGPAIGQAMGQMGGAMGRPMGGRPMGGMRRGGGFGRPRPTLGGLYGARNF